MLYPDKLTLSNLHPSEEDKLLLRLFSSKQRLALYNLCEIFRLTFYDKEMRQAAKSLRELIRKNTFDGDRNKCEFDMTVADKKTREIQQRMKKSALPKK